MPNNCLNMNKQRGATLVVALIVLVVLMILGVGAVMTANTQFKMAGNLQFENMAKNRAENQIVSAESWLNANGGINLDPSFTTAWSAATKERHPQDQFATLGILNNDPLNMTNAQWQANSNVSLANPDGYMIELLGLNKSTAGASGALGSGGPTNGCNSVNLFRVTARGISPRGGVRFVQSIYEVLSC